MGWARTAIHALVLFTCLPHGTKQRVAPETPQPLSTLEDLAPRETRWDLSLQYPSMGTGFMGHQGRSRRNPSTPDLLYYHGPFPLSWSDIACYNPGISGRTVTSFTANAEPPRRRNLRFTVATLIAKGFYEHSVISPVIAPRIAHCCGLEVQSHHFRPLILSWSGNLHGPRARSYRYPDDSGASIICNLKPLFLTSDRG